MNASLWTYSTHPLPVEIQGGAEPTNITRLSQHKVLLTNQVSSLMSERASKTKMELLGQRKYLDRANQEEELTCDVKPGDISNFIKE